MPTDLPQVRIFGCKAGYEDVQIAQGQIEIVDLVSERLAQILIWMRYMLVGY